MARYREYKNGIYGHRYRGMYIIKGEKGKFMVQDEYKEIIKRDIFDYDDSEWVIDKLRATPEEMGKWKELYGKEIFQLSSMLMELIQKKDEIGLKDKEKELYKMVLKVRKRKAENRDF